MSIPDERAERIANDIYAWAKRFADEHEQRPTGRITLADLESDIQDFCNAAGPDKVQETLFSMEQLKSQNQESIRAASIARHQPDTRSYDFGFQISLSNVGPESGVFIANRDPDSSVFRWPSFRGYISDAIGALAAKIALLSPGLNNPMVDPDTWKESTSWLIVQGMCSEIERLTISLEDRAIKRAEERDASKREMHQLIDDANPGAPMARLLRLIVETL